MEDFVHFRNIHILVLMIFLFSLSFPQYSSALRSIDDEDLSEKSTSLVKKQSDNKSGSHLQPINENQLDDLSPALIAPKTVKISSQEYEQILNQEFDNSICFKRCHNKNDIKPSDNTVKQWRLLIEEDGHAIFGKILWENDKQKEAVLNYLFNNAGNSKPEPAGIGVW
ncbi:MAG: hypothetical protein HF978_20540 [Desulfobacteraceae bacterium]|nr:hypothetical protein [Desulfobacteraceae bacterium]MBC2757937.1 hypothetical protein [Desulfobacteraceae bacterium]